MGSEMCIRDRLRGARAWFRSPPPAGKSACDVEQESMGDEEDDSAAAAAAEMPWPPEKWEVGLLCDAKDEFGTWYKGKVVDVDPAKHPDEVKVHYNGTGPAALGNGHTRSN